MRILEHIAILAAIACATWAFCVLLDRAIDHQLPQPATRAAPYTTLSDYEHVSNSAHASKLYRPREVKP